MATEGGAVGVVTRLELEDDEERLAEEEGADGTATTTATGTTTSGGITETSSTNKGALVWEGGKNNEQRMIMQEHDSHATGFTSTMTTVAEAGGADDDKHQSQPRRQDDQRKGSLLLDGDTGGVDGVVHHQHEEEEEEEGRNMSSSLYYQQQRQHHGCNNPSSSSRPQQQQSPSSTEGTHGNTNRINTKQQYEEGRRLKQKQLTIAFWLMGLLNNTSYVIMIAGAKSISDGGTAMVYLATVLPSLLIKLSAPFWFHLVNYTTRIGMAMVLMMVSFCIVAYFSWRYDVDSSSSGEGDGSGGGDLGGLTTAATTALTGASVSATEEGMNQLSTDVGFELVGVFVMAIQQGLGEASLLALAGRYATPPGPSSSSSNSRTTSKPDATFLTAFSSGTGLAGVFGYAWVTALHLWLGYTFATTLLLANVLALAFGGVFWMMLGEGPDHHLHYHGDGGGEMMALPLRDMDCDDEDDEGEKEEGQRGREEMSIVNREKSSIGGDGDGDGGTMTIMADVESDRMELLPHRSPQSGREKKKKREGTYHSTTDTTTLITTSSTAAGAKDNEDDVVGRGDDDDVGDAFLQKNNDEEDDFFQDDDDHIHGDDNHNNEGRLRRLYEDLDVDEMTGCQQLRLVSSLWPYMVPLFSVYFAEYALQSGTWTSIGFPVTDKSARDKFYEYGNWVYQIGVFLSRSSGTIFQASIRTLWIMPFLQVANLLFFYWTAVSHVWYNWGLLSLCFFAGCLGGGVYVNAYTRINADLPAHHVEFSLSSASMADSFGVMFADITGLFLQSCLYKANGIEGAVVSCPW